MLDSIHLEIVLNLMQDRCTVCAERSAGSEIVMDTPDGTPSTRGSRGSLMQSIQR
jgi:hypothetical protein